MVFKLKTSEPDLPDNRQSPTTQLFQFRKQNSKNRVGGAINATQIIINRYSALLNHCIFYVANVSAYSGSTHPIFAKQILLETAMKKLSSGYTAKTSTMNNFTFKFL